MITQVLAKTIQPLTSWRLSEAVFVSILFMKGCMIQESYCCEVCIKHKHNTQAYKVAFSVLICRARRNVGGGRGCKCPQFLANHSLEEKAEGLDF